MNRIPLKSQSIIPRIDGIMRDLVKLRELVSLPQGEFSDTQKDYFDVAKLRLREALEGVFNIGAHILSRIEGGRTTAYKEIAKKLGAFGIMEKDFADGALTDMAGYRNRLTHFYADVPAAEIYEVLHKHLGDFDVFLAAVKQVLEHPEQFGLSVE